MRKIKRITLVVLLMGCIVIIIGGALCNNIFNIDSGSSAPAPKAPTIITTPARIITSNSAQLAGTLNPNGATTTVYFNYGLTTSYTVTTTSQTFDAVGGTSFFEVEYSVDIGGLSANTEYNFRLVGTNAVGTTYGNNLTFTTAP